MEVVGIVVEIVVIATLQAVRFARGVVGSRFPVHVGEKVHAEESEDVVNDHHEPGEATQVLEEVDDDADENSQTLDMRHDPQQAEDNDDIHHPDGHVVMEDVAAAVRTEGAPRT